MVKVFKKEFEQEFEREIKTFDEIQKRTKDKDLTQFICKVDHNMKKLAIVFSPYGAPVRQLTQGRFEKMLECVEKLQIYGIIHRDISPNHFMHKIAPDGSDQVRVLFERLFFSFTTSRIKLD